MRSLLTGLIGISLISQVYAANINDLDVGDGVYLQGIFSDELVQIIRIDYQGNRVKVRRRTDQTTKWVSASNILTREESIGNDVARWGIGLGLAICALDPEACKNSGQNTRSQGSGKQSLRSSTGQAGHKIRVTNSCRYPVRFAMHYQEPDKSWKTVGWWGIDEKKHRYLNFTNGSYALTNNATTYYYAETTDGKKYWGGNDLTKVVEGRSLSMKKHLDKQGDTDIRLSCPN